MARARKVHENVYLVGGPGISHDQDCCVYLIDFGKELALIDAGAGKGTGTLVHNIMELGFDPMNLGLVVATHAHIDHVGGFDSDARPVRSQTRRSQSGRRRPEKSRRRQDRGFLVRHHPPAHRSGPAAGRRIGKLDHGREKRCTGYSLPATPPAPSALIWTPAANGCSLDRTSTAPFRKASARTLRNGTNQWTSSSSWTPISCAKAISASIREKAR